MESLGGRPRRTMAGDCLFRCHYRGGIRYFRALGFSADATFRPGCAGRLRYRHPREFIRPAAPGRSRTEESNEVADFASHASPRLIKVGQRGRAHGMKIIGTFGLAVAASFTLMQSAEARGGGHSGGAHFSGGFAGGGHYSAPARSYGGARSYAPRSYAGPSRNYSGTAGRYYSPRVSSMPNNHSSIATRPRYSPTTTALRNPTYVSGSRRFSGDRTAAFNTRTSRSNGQQLTPGTRTAANRSQGFNQGRVIARHSASTWHRICDHGHAHFWDGQLG